MSEHSVTLGGGKHPEQHKHEPAKPVQNSANPEVPAEYIDNEFSVPTDSVALPSEGIFYPGRQKTVLIKYLIADDENILTSPELIQNGKVLDVLLEHAIIDKNLRPDAMLTGDRNAILLSLRSSGYGDDYEIKMNCPKCKEEYETSVKLSELKYKLLEIAPDERGEFDTTLPKMKLNIKFRLLTGKDEALLTKKAEVTKKMKNNVQVSSQITERYLLQIMEIEGNRDKGYIKKAIGGMPIADSLFIREYISQIEPGVDMTHEFECTGCGHTYVDTVPITAKLFWPNAKL